MDLLEIGERLVDLQTVGEFPSSWVTNLIAGETVGCGVSEREDGVSEWDVLRKWLS